MILVPMLVLATDEVAQIIFKLGAVTCFIRPEVVEVFSNDASVSVEVRWKPVIKNSKDSFAFRRWEWTDFF